MRIPEVLIIAFLTLVAFTSLATASEATIVELKPTQPIPSQQQTATASATAEISATVIDGAAFGQAQITSWNSQSSNRSFQATVVTMKDPQNLSVTLIVLNCE